MASWRKNGGQWHQRSDRANSSRFDTKDALFDITWSEAHENQIVTGCGDGSVKLFDITLNQFPIASWSEHGREVFAVHWNLVNKDTFLSSSWDGTIRIWNPSAPRSVATIPTGSCTYSAQFSPHSPSVLSAVTADSHVRVYDLRTPSSAQNHLVLAFPNHAGPGPAGSSAGLPPAEVLTHDWNKYRDGVIATAGVDRAVRCFDTRAPGRGPYCALAGHDFAVRRVSWSPHLADVLLSASYDMTCRVWTDGTAGGGDPAAGGGRELGRMGRHTEFATGVDWCLFGAEGWCASCAWDERVLVWDVRGAMQP